MKQVIKTNNDNVITQIKRVKDNYSLLANEFAVNGDLDVGGVYVSGEYTQPAPYTAPPIRRLSVRSFLQRIPQASRIAIRASTDDIVIDLYEDLKLATFVDLDHPQVAQGLGYLVSLNILTQAEADACLVDGTGAEQYE